MSKLKLSPLQAEYLILIDDHCISAESDSPYWVPPRGNKTSYSKTLNRDLFVDGSGVASALKALERKGLIRFHRVTPFASQITESGRVQIEKWRETNTWPVKVAV